MAAIDFSKGNKQNLVDNNQAPVTTLEIEFSWEQEKKRFGGNVDVDATAITYAAGRAVGNAGPKHLETLSGAVRHHGNVKKGAGEGAGERITMKFLDIRDEDSDIDRIALTASCAKGNFNKVDEAICRLFSVAPDGTQSHIGNVRVGINGDHSGVLIAILRREADGNWSIERYQNVTSHNARDWRELDLNLVSGKL